MRGPLAAPAGCTWRTATTLTTAAPCKNHAPAVISRLHRAPPTPAPQLPISYALGLLPQTAADMPPQPELADPALSALPREPAASPTAGTLTRMRLMQRSSCCALPATCCGTSGRSSPKSRSTATVSPTQCTCPSAPAVPSEVACRRQTSTSVPAAAATTASPCLSRRPGRGAAPAPTTGAHPSAQPACHVRHRFASSCRHLDRGSSVSSSCGVHGTCMAGEIETRSCPQRQPVVSWSYHCVVVPVAMMATGCMFPYA